VITRDIRTRQRVAFGVLAFILFISLAMVLAIWHSYPFTWTHTSIFWIFNHINAVFHPESSRYALLGLAIHSACRKFAMVVAKRREGGGTGLEESARGG